MSEATSPSTSANSFDHDTHAIDDAAPMWRQPDLSPSDGAGGGRTAKKTTKKAATKGAKKVAKKPATKKSPAKASTAKVAKKVAAKPTAAKKTTKVAAKTTTKPGAKPAAKPGAKPTAKKTEKKVGVTPKVAPKKVSAQPAASTPPPHQATPQSLERANVKEGDLELNRAGRPAMVDEPTPRRGSLGHVPRPTQDELPEAPAAQPPPGEERADIGDRSDLPDRGEVDRAERDGPRAQDLERDRPRPQPAQPRQEQRRDDRQGDRHPPRRDDRPRGDQPRNDQRRNEPRRDDRPRDNRYPRDDRSRNQPRNDRAHDSDRSRPQQGGHPDQRGPAPRHEQGRGPTPPPKTPRGQDNRGPRPQPAQGPGGAPAAVDPEHDRRDDAPPEQHEPLNPDTFDTAKTFADLGLHQAIVRGVSDLGFRHPTHIQSRLVPVFLTGKDILGQAKTGTGKTAAFALPLLHMVTRGQWGQALILAPTRELAIQIHAEFGKLGKHMPVRAVPIYGGQPIKTQAEKLERGAEIIVGTPGRVMDMIERRLIDPRSVRFAVLDEVDRMLDIGFREDIRRILSKTPSERQTVMVSATIRGDIEDLARRYMRSPEKLVTTAGALTVDLVEQHYLSVDGWDKRRLMHHLLTHEAPALTLVFCRLKRTVDELASYLNRHGIEAHAMHGDMSQSKRNSTMRQLRAGQLAVLIASDLASRGIDVDGITHVINYDLPEDPDVYVHRIGRTARAGRDGVAWSFVTPAQGKLLTQIENLINAQIPKMDYPDFQPTPRPEGYREEPTGGRPIYEVQGVEKARNRYAETERPDLPAAVVAMKADATKFPGGIVPTKLPPNRMRGRVRSGR